MGKLNKHSLIYSMKNNCENWLNRRQCLRFSQFSQLLSHTHSTELPDKHLRSDNNVVWCAHTRIRPSGHDVLNYMRTSSCTEIKHTKPVFFVIYMKPTAHDGTTTSATENYDGNGKGCIIFIANTVEMPQSYTVAMLRDQWYHWLDNHWIYGSPICITELIIQIRDQYLTTALYCLHSRDSVVVHYVHFYGVRDTAAVYYTYW